MSYLLRRLDNWMPAPEQEDWTERKRRRRLRCCRRQDSADGREERSRLLSKLAR